jgi:hypothetical protein
MKHPFFHVLDVSFNEKKNISLFTPKDIGHGFSEAACNVSSTISRRMISTQKFALLYD